ncbi:MAG: hypothetical protein ABEK16_01975 [Candidatus Nanohalobium sp.]
MKEYQRQLVLLIGVMTLLVAAFMMVLATSPDALQLDTKAQQRNSSLNQSQLELPGPLNRSLTGLQQLYKDFSKGMSFTFKSSKSS